ncbi:MAG: hypothetical protein A2932_00980 [Candidatus Spechtbacteria bacterium RIFCSPLOWO2_01_FULL_46_10]|uniref:Response regulatory domain-containing protein n=1 Tax=Candidatus Spechtbacteria bacterium RIFCSPLOWO2_01_FULL_46_10 TaxID=1802163 RepID=A0A1G2HF82_9BACT|nr:MAG: hypothetical protein A2932_00980 [Candidatus Spechtbacteria bacterium RIFCSPLOWO2_01_FULL_46_10]
MAKAKTIIIVEDDKFLLGILSDRFEAEGFTVIQAMNGSEAVKKTGEARPDLVLLDLILPELNGFEVMEKLKADARTKNIPVIILSNLGSEEDMERGKKLGAVDYLVKAYFTPDEIVQKVRGAID